MQTINHLLNSNRRFTIVDENNTLLAEHVYLVTYAEDYINDWIMYSMFAHPSDYPYSQSLVFSFHSKEIVKIEFDK